MRDNFEKDFSHSAGELVVDFWKELGIIRDDYHEKLGNELFAEVDADDHVGTLTSWKKEGRGIPADRTPDELFNAIERVVKKYTNNEKIPAAKRAEVSAKWQEMRDRFKEDLEFKMLAPSEVTKAIRKIDDRTPLVDKLKGPFDVLPLDTRFKLCYHFDVWDTLPEYDYLFMYHCQELNGEEKAGLLDYLKTQTIPAAVLLDCLWDDFTKCWLDMLSASNTKKSGADIWEDFSQKLLERNGDLTLWRGIIELFQRGGQLDSTDVDLMLLFKYSVNEDRKKDFISKLNERIHKRA